MLLKQRNILEKNNNQNKPLSALLSSNIIQQNLNLEHLYRNQIQGYHSIKLDEEGELFNIHREVVQISREIKELEEGRNNIKNIQIIQPPIAKQLTPQKSTTKRNIILSSFMGLFLMMFLAFFFEYIRKHKSKIGVDSLT
ncbi:MAG: hypothetical protein JRF60_01545 [Deltaproteobacteria bacterium]|nr:hypothetical protein [Deltaproteobacteria bacterium]